VNPEVAQFCLACGTPLGRQSSPVAEEERKTVTVLFCDLVGFTAASDLADPEDVRARIRPYHTRLRTVIEGFGGTVEKFIGDAVMAVFGAPAAHEDDPERAVRAGLAILDAIADLNEADAGLGLAVRVGVETGEVVVALGARPELGEGLVAGDVVNTASRLQGVAPVGGVLAGPGTYAATKKVFDYRPLEPVVLKGKAQLVPVWQAVAARARLGTDVTRSMGTPMVGRQADLGILTGALERAVAESAVQLVVVAGEPGVGKSRLVAELGAFADARAELIRWRQGRCLPYGDGVTFWALGEIVKAEAGILETDSPDMAGAKIDAIIPHDAPEAPWLRARLRPLAGLAAPQAAREENFAAWRAWIELLAEARPTVLVVEDLHWADPVLLEFLEHLAADVAGVPLVLAATTRPELFGTAPTWGASARNLARVNLAPLGATDIARLIANLLGTAVLPAAVQQAIAGRSGGNPLYAEQFVRLLRDQHILTRSGAGWRIDPRAEIPVPPGVHGLIAARLDMLTPERKRLLHDAAVVGEVFWSGALADMGHLDDDRVRAVLHDLARTDLIRPARRSSMAGQAEYAFAHALIREACYGQIPRAGRAHRHQRAAAWIEQAAGDRVGDHAEILAAHYTTALQLARAANDRQAGELAASAVRYLMLAGDRAMGLDVAAAEPHYAAALQLCSDDDPSRASLLACHGGALRQRARYPAAARAYEQAIELFRSQDDPRPLAAALHGYGLVLQQLDDFPRMLALSAEALSLLEPLGPSPDLVHALAYEAGIKTGSGDYQHGIELADRAIALAAQLGLPLQAWALGFRGWARADLGEAGGLDDLRTARDAATAQGSGYEAAFIRQNLAETAMNFEGPRKVLGLAHDGADFARRRGIEEAALWADRTTLEALAHLGSLDEALSLAAELDRRLEQAGDLRTLIGLRATRLRALTIRGEHAAAAALVPWLSEHAEHVGYPEDLAEVYPPLAAVRAADGDASGAKALLAKLSQTPSAHFSVAYAAHLAEAVRAALAAAPDLAAPLAAPPHPAYPLGQHALITARALLAEHHGQQAQASALFADAAQRWERFEMPWEQAQALLGQGRCLLALGQPNEASQPLRTAREILVTLGAKPTLADADRLLAQTATASA
jgi:class 3 adenylate cyclase/tetratricopeptide (TPR) repeat protein